MGDDRGHSRRGRVSLLRVADAAFVAAGLAAAAYALTFPAVRRWTIIAAAVCSVLLVLAFLGVWVVQAWMKPPGDGRRHEDAPE